MKLPQSYQLLIVMSPPAAHPRKRMKVDSSLAPSIRITLTALCDMDLRLFPLDTQNCDLVIESCKYIYFKIHVLIGTAFRN